ncbi:MAG TPA: YrdB family protein [Candidatus Limnocylindria bacterium]|nr:YrdB family protein [Candidatus Limnocylindria bacterium]
MAATPAVLGLHFLLELIALFAVGYWGWMTHDGTQRWLWAMALPLLLATVWAVFRVPGDGGDPIVTVPGPVRLLIELGIMGTAVALLWSSGQATWAIVLLALVVLDYGLQYDRVARLLGR